MSARLSTVYLDSNIFISAGSVEEEIGRNSRSLIKSIIQGKAKGITAALTFDESFYQLNRNKGRAQALIYCENFLSLPNLEFKSVDMAIISEALELLKAHNFQPRDAIHAAVALAGKADVFVTEDQSFPKIPELAMVNTKKALSALGAFKNR